MKRVFTVVFLLIVVILVVVILERHSIHEYATRAFVAAAWKGDVGKMRFWRLLGADPKKLMPGMGPPLVGAASSGRVEALRYLVDCGVDLEQKDKEGYTPLIEAADEGHVDAIRYLLERGANVNATSWDGSALKLAIENRHPEAAELLRQHGGRDCVSYPVYSCK